MGVKTFFHKALSVALIAAISFEVVTANIHLSAEDATKVKQFCADFGELANIVAETGAFSSSANEYKSEATDDAVNAWINERFILRYGREYGTSLEKTYLGQSSEDIDSGDSWGGNSYWTITKDGWLKRKATATGDQMLRKWDTLVVKGASGSAAILKNFEASFTVNQNFSERSSDNKAGRGAVTLFFRQKSIDVTNNSSEQAAVVIGKGGDAWNTATKSIGISVLSGLEITDTVNDIYKNTKTPIDDLDSVEQFRVVVRVVGKDCEVSITSPEGLVVYYNQSYTLSVEDYGYISFGITNSTRSIGNITLTELNEQGEAVDFSADNTDAAPMFFSIRDLVPYNGGYTVNWGNTTKTAWYPFYSEWNDQANIFRHFIADTFNTYNNYGTVYYSLSWDAMTNVHDCFGSASENQWLQCYQKETDSRTLGRITSLVYKDADTGDEVIYKNFRTKLSFRFEGNNGGLVLGFRQNRAGKFLDGDGVLNQKQGIVAITKTGITVASGKQIGDVPIDGTQTDFGFTLPQVIGVSLKLVGNVLNIQISDSAGVILFSQAYTVEYDTAGYLAYGVSAKNHSIADITLTHLDDEGLPIGLHEYTSDESFANYDSDNTDFYDFTDDNQLSDFESYFIPLAFSGYQVIDSAEQNDWYVSNGKLKRTASSLARSDSDYRSESGVDINGINYQCSWANGWYSNFSALVLKRQKYKEFELNVDFTIDDGYWPMVGFGAEGTSLEDIFCTQRGGGYAVYLEREGRVKLWGWKDSNWNSNEPYFTENLSGYSASGVKHHIRMLVSGNILYLYIDDYDTPIVQMLPSTYDGGYIYLATQSVKISYDNLKITDLDAKQIVISRYDGSFDSITIDRAAKESLELPQCTEIIDENNFRYLTTLSWDGGDYRSYKNGTYTVSGTPTLHNAVIAEDADLSNLTVEVTNNINGDYNADTSIRYYFDTSDDLKDFSAYYNEKVSYGGNLDAADVGQNWIIMNGKLLRNTAYLGTPSNDYNETNLVSKVSTLILNKAEEKYRNLLNYQLELEFSYASDTWWWPMVAIGVNNPEKFIKVQTGTNSFKVQNEGGGIYVFNEKEGYLQAWGAVLGSERERSDSRLLDADGNSLPSTFKKDGTHCLKIRVYDGTAYISVDGSQELVANMDFSAWGGCIGFAAHNAAVSYDNLTVTALDSDGNPIPFSQAQRGFSEKPSDESYTGWEPTEEDLNYGWSDEYIK